MRRAASAMEAAVTAFGSAQRIRLANAAGMSVELTNYGATILSVKVPSKGGPAEEVTLCHTNLEDLQKHSPYYGCTVGRVANRTAKGRFSVDGKEYSLAVNNGPNSLHGGVKGFDKQLWAPRVYVTPSAAGVEFSFTSADGEEGFPGELQVKADYRLTDANELVMEFTATTDKATPVNLCNHAYWNLSGGLRAGIAEHVLRLDMPFITPVDATQIPTGEVLPVAGTDFDFTAPRRVGERIMAVDGGGKPGYDHNFARARTADLPPNGFTHGLTTIAELTDPVSGRSMRVDTNAPGVQLYTGNWLGPAEKADAHRALCLETQNWPDAVNKPGVFPDPILRPGQTYRHVALHAFKW